MASETTVRTDRGLANRARVPNATMRPLRHMDRANALRIGWREDVDFIVCKIPLYLALS